MVRALLLAAVLGLFHPQDGPHVDLRIEIQADRIVQHVAMNLVFLDEFCPVNRERSDDIDPAELAHVGEALADAMAAHAPMTVDGVRVPPRIQALRLAAVDPTQLPLFPRSGMRGMRRVEFDAIYSCKRPPDTVSIGWDVYPADILSTPEQPRTIVISAELEGEGRRQGIELSADAPRFEWHAPTGRPQDELLAVPTPPQLPAARAIWPLLAGAGVCAVLAVWPAALAVWPAVRTRGRVRTAVRTLAALGAAAFLLPVALSARQPQAALPTQAEALAAFEPIHANLYRALDYVREADVYEVLARSADGPLLETLYRQMRRSLTIEEAGGAVGRVLAVRPVATKIERIDVQAAPDASDAAARAVFTVDSTWQVDGTVSHWGHRHDRTNQYRARYTVAATPAGWRIVSQELLEEERIDTPPETLPLDKDGIM